ncbi:hypothetical protein [Inconstantimicrobium mannanitabidum]|uniref:Uncharacterized protein n=1 Tax=Inconstantimicrobium mannanitabidum TaxID=1604901 RepID=A0ACB5RID2_9CLOT|nr:hypothetical protein [Clostridium sp. TW13]GKX68620.1 hypothetical protein rsdtw13_38780 [Clostridium sp. TW13]
MNANNSKVGAIVGLLSVVITQIFFRVLGVNDVSTWICITLLLAIGVSFPVMMLCSDNEKLGKKNSILAGLTMSAVCISSAIVLFMIRCYPEFGDEHKIIAMGIILVAFISYIVLGVFWTMIYVKLKNDRK